MNCGVRLLATTLKPVDVAVVGLGAAGGAAVLPLARAGIKVVALEAGTWMRHDQYRPDEIHNNVRRRVESDRAIDPLQRTQPGERTKNGLWGGASQELMDRREPS
jgi:choline dehydrogenase-like flavoprotein